MKNLTISLILLACVLMSACASKPIFNKPMATQQDFYKDKSDCGVQTAQANPHPNPNRWFGISLGDNEADTFFKECMAGRGWVKQ